MKKLIATVDYPFKLLKDGKINGKALERAEAEFNQSMLQDATETKKLLSFVIRKIFETFFEKQTAPNSEVVEIGSGLRLLSEILNNTLSNHNLTLHETYGSRHMVKTLRENGQKEKVKASQICPVQSIAQRFENIGTTVSLDVLNTFSTETLTTAMQSCFNAMAPGASMCHLMVLPIDRNIFINMVHTNKKNETAVPYMNEKMQLGVKFIQTKDLHGPINDIFWTMLVQNINGTTGKDSVFGNLSQRYETTPGRTVLVKDFFKAALTETATQAGFEAVSYKGFKITDTVPQQTVDAYMQSCSGMEVMRDWPSIKYVSGHLSRGTTPRKIRNGQNLVTIEATVYQLTATKPNLRA